MRRGKSSKKFDTESEDLTTSQSIETTPQSTILHNRIDLNTKAKRDPVNKLPRRCKLNGTNPVSVPKKEFKAIGVTTPVVIDTEQYVATSNKELLMLSERLDEQNILESDPQKDDVIIKQEICEGRSIKSSNQSVDSFSNNSHLDDSSLTAYSTLSPMSFDPRQVAKSEMESSDSYSFEDVSEIQFCQLKNESGTTQEDELEKINGRRGLTSFVRSFEGRSFSDESGVKRNGNNCFSMMDSPLHTFSNSNNESEDERLSEVLRKASKYYDASDPISPTNIIMDCTLKEDLNNATFQKPISYDTNINNMVREEDLKKATGSEIRNIQSRPGKFLMDQPECCIDLSAEVTSPTEIYSNHKDGALMFCTGNEIGDPCKKSEGQNSQRVNPGTYSDCQNYESDVYSIISNIKEPSQSCSKEALLTCEKVGFLEHNYVDNNNISKKAMELDCGQGKARSLACDDCQKISEDYTVNIIHDITDRSIIYEGKGGNNSSNLTLRKDGKCKEQNIRHQTSSAIENMLSTFDTSSEEDEDELRQNVDCIREFLKVSKVAEYRPRGVASMSEFSETRESLCSVTKNEVEKNVHYDCYQELQHSIVEIGNVLRIVGPVALATFQDRKEDEYERNQNAVQEENTVHETSATSNDEIKYEVRGSEQVMNFQAADIVSPMGFVTLESYQTEKDDGIKLEKHVDRFLDLQSTVQKARSFQSPSTDLKDIGSTQSSVQFVHVEDEAEECLFMSKEPCKAPSSGDTKYCGKTANDNSICSGNNYHEVKEQEFDCNDALQKNQRLDWSLQTVQMSSPLAPVTVEVFKNENDYDKKKQHVLARVAKVVQTIATNQTEDSLNGRSRCADLNMNLNVDSVHKDDTPGDIEEDECVITSVGFEEDPKLIHVPVSSFDIIFRSADSYSPKPSVFSDSTFGLRCGFDEPPPLVPAPEPHFYNQQSVTPDLSYNKQKTNTNLKTTSRIMPNNLTPKSQKDLLEIYRDIPKDSITKCVFESLNVPKADPARASLSEFINGLRRSSNAAEASFNAPKQVFRAPIIDCGNETSNETSRKRTQTKAASFMPSPKKVKLTSTINSDSTSYIESLLMLESPASIPPTRLLPSENMANKASLPNLSSCIHYQPIQYPQVDIFDAFNSQKEFQKFHVSNVRSPGPVLQHLIGTLPFFQRKTRCHVHIAELILRKQVIGLPPNTKILLNKLATKPLARRLVVPSSQQNLHRAQYPYMLPYSPEPVDLNPETLRKLSTDFSDHPQPIKISPNNHQPMLITQLTGRPNQSHQCFVPTQNPVNIFPTNTILLLN